MLRQKYKENSKGRLENPFASEIIRKREDFKKKRSLAGKLSYVLKYGKSKFNLKTDDIEYIKANINYDELFELDTKNEQSLNMCLNKMLNALNGNVIGNNIINGEEEDLKGDGCGEDEGIEYFQNIYLQNLPDDHFKYWQSWVEHCIETGEPLTRTAATVQIKTLRDNSLELDVSEIIVQTIRSRHKGFDYIIEKLLKAKNGERGKNNGNGRSNRKVKGNVSPEEFTEELNGMY